MRIRQRLLTFASAGLTLLLAAPNGAPHTPAPVTEIPLQRCDRLPIVILQVDKADKRFLVDTAATSMLNAKSFKSGHSKEVRIQSWNEMTTLNASDVSIGEL